MNLHEIKMHITQHILNDEIPLILKISIIMLSPSMLYMVDANTLFLSLSSMLSHTYM